MRIAVCASEGAPYAKSGGLGDVMEALPTALARLEGNEVALFLPYYGENCQIDGCIVADGCMLGGSARSSVLFRQVEIAPDAEVENCVIMNDSVVGKGAQLKNVILDKNVTVTPGTKLFGTKANPIVIKRGEIV